MPSWVPFDRVHKSITSHRTVAAQGCCLDVCCDCLPRCSLTLCASAAGRSAKKLLVQSLNKMLHQGLQLSSKAQSSALVRGNPKEKDRGISSVPFVPLACCSAGAAVTEGRMHRGLREGHQQMLHPHVLCAGIIWLFSRC